MRRSPMKRGKPLARNSAGLKRTKRLGPGKKTKAKQASMRGATLAYFNGAETAKCQLSGLNIRLDQAVAHHKTPRSVLRKAGVKDLDAPERLLILHKDVHFFWLHRKGIGRPMEPAALAMFYEVENSTANAANGQSMALSNEALTHLASFILSRRLEC